MHALDSDTLTLEQRILVAACDVVGNPGRKCCLSHLESLVRQQYESSWRGVRGWPMLTTHSTEIVPPDADEDDLIEVAAMLDEVQGLREPEGVPALEGTETVQ